MSVAGFLETCRTSSSELLILIYGFVQFSLSDVEIFRPPSAGIH
jgi:hypothetical protein